MQRFIGLLLAALTASSLAAQQSNWAEFDREWRSLHVSIRTDAGVFSPALQNLDRAGKRIEPFSHDELSGFVGIYFAQTSVLRTLSVAGLEDMFDATAVTEGNRWGYGHALPYIAAITMQNIIRPIPTSFGKAAPMPPTAEFVRGGSIDTSKPDYLRFVVYSNLDQFHERAKQSGHPSGRAYFDAARHEIGMALDMQRFRSLYANLEKDPDRRILIIPAFIAYVSDLFNDDSAHEIAHFIQEQSKDPAYRLPAIAEGEADTNGYYRSRTGLFYSLTYNSPEWWTDGKIDEAQLQFRLTILKRMGRPPRSPFEVQRFNELKSLGEQGKRIPVGKLLSLGPEFYSGDASDVWSRYLQSWALCALGNSSDSASELLRAAVAARLAGHPDLNTEATLDSGLNAFIAKPVTLAVSKDLMSKAAEDIFKQDPTFSGVINAWQYIADPTNVRALIYLGDSLYRGDDFNAAEKYYREALRLRPDSALPLLRLGDIEKETGNLPKATEFWHRAEHTSSTDQDEAMFRKEALERQTKFSGQ